MTPLLKELRNFSWFSPTTTGISVSKDVSLNEENIRDVLIYYLFKMVDRTIIYDRLPEYTEDIEERTENEHISVDRDKMSWFEETFKKIFEDIKTSSLRGLVEKYSKDWPKAEDLVLEGENWKVEDLLNKTSRLEFTGYPFTVGKEDLSVTQKELLDNERVLTAEEFFSVGYKITPKLKYVTKKEGESLVDMKTGKKEERFKVDQKETRMEIKFDIDHSHGNVQKKIFREAFPKAKIVSEDDPEKHGSKAIEHMPSGGWKYRYSNRVRELGTKEDWADEERAKEEAKVRVTQLDKKHTIDLDKQSTDLVSEIFNELTSKEIKREDLVKKLGEQLIDKGLLFPHIKKVGMATYLDAWHFYDYSVTLIIRVNNNFNLKTLKNEGELFSETEHVVKPGQMISKTMLGKLAEQHKAETSAKEGRGLSSWSYSGKVYKPRAYTGESAEEISEVSSKPRKLKDMTDKDLEERMKTWEETAGATRKKGFNPTREYFARKINSRVKELEENLTYLV